MTTVAPTDTFSIGGDLPVHRLGYGAMQLPGPGVWGEPADPDKARADGEGVGGRDRGHAASRGRPAAGCHGVSGWGSLRSRGCSSRM